MGPTELRSVDAVLQKVIELQVILILRFQVRQGRCGGYRQPSGLLYRFGVVVLGTPSIDFWLRYRGGGRRTDPFLRIRWQGWRGGASHIERETAEENDPRNAPATPQ